MIIKILKITLILSLVSLIESREYDGVNSYETTRRYTTERQDYSGSDNQDDYQESGSQLDAIIIIG